MKAKHLRERLDKIARILDDEAPDGFASVQAISQVTSLARVFSAQAQIRFKKPEPLTVEDEWLLSAFFATHLHEEFEDACQRICEADHAEFPHLGARKPLISSTARPGAGHRRPCRTVSPRHRRNRQHADLRGDPEPPARAARDL